MWEIFSYGAKPFEGIKNSEVKTLIEEKYRLQRPTTCPRDIYELMLECWEYDGSKRPSFQKLQECLSHLLNPNQIPKSHSIQSVSSERTSGNNTVTIMKMIPLNRNLSQSRLELTVAESSSVMTPPPKPPLRTQIDLHATTGSISSQLFRSRPSKPNHFAISALNEQNNGKVVLRLFFFLDSLVVIFLLILKLISQNVATKLL